MARRKREPNLLDWFGLCGASSVWFRVQSVDCPGPQIAFLSFVPIPTTEQLDNQKAKEMVRVTVEKDSR